VASSQWNSARWCRISGTCLSWIPNRFVEIV
jgi:hypothetical protein